MVFDEQEQNDLKERGQKFLKTKRMKKFKNESKHDDDAEMKENNVTQVKEEKKKATPSKAIVKKDDAVVQQPKKAGRKPNPEKEKQVKPPQNIFSTVKQTT